MMKQPTPDIDGHIGHRLRQQRQQQDLSEAEVARCLGVTITQLRLYERGTKRVPPRNLIAAAEFFKISIGWFFQDISTSESFPSLSGVNADVVRFLSIPEAYSLISAFIALKTEKKRVEAVASVRSIEK